jgi:hypothetical protein
MTAMAQMGPAGRAALGEAARERMISGFSLASATERYAALYESLQLKMD